MCLWREIGMLFSFAISFTSRRIPCWGGDGREEDLLEHVLKNAEQGSPESVIRVIDEFANAGTWFMNIGNVKGRILDTAIVNKDPALVLELGTYCGYSAIRIASQLKQPGSKVISLEINPRYHEVAKRIINHAGMGSKVDLQLMPLTLAVDSISSTLKAMNKSCIDFVFIDHAKGCYLPDYKLLKETRLVGEGTVIFADNMGFPGSPDYWSFLHSSTTHELETVYHRANVEYLKWIPDTIAISIFHEVPLPA